MTRRELLINWCRLALLKWRVARKTALPAVGMNCLVYLDGWAVRLHRKADQ